MTLPYSRYLKTHAARSDHRRKCRTLQEQESVFQFGGMEHADGNSHPVRHVDVYADAVVCARRDNGSTR